MTPTQFDAWVRPADDDPSMRRPLATLLRSVGVDVRLPGMSGLTFQQLAKAGAALPVTELVRMADRLGLPGAA